MRKLPVHQTDHLEKITLSGIQEISEGVFVISWQRTHDFVPGQVVKITLAPDIPPRIYSICSSNSDPEMRVLFNVKEDGLLTPRLSAAIPGDKLLVSKPYGSFRTCKERAWWIATGTGLAPFYAMFQSGLGENKRLIHGVRKLSQFYFEDELDWAMGDRYVRCCSQESAYNVYHGRVTDFLKNEPSLPPNNKYYLCGKALMVVEVRDLLIERGVPYGDILAEIYF